MIKYLLPTALAIGIALVIALSYLLPLPELAAPRQILTDWAVTLAGLAVLLGVLNATLVNLRRVQSQSKGWPYNLVTAMGIALMLFAGVIETLLSGQPAYSRPDSLSAVLYQGIIVASGAALASLVLFSLVLGAMRLLEYRPNPWSILFVAVVIVMLLGWLPIGPLRNLLGLREWLMNVPAAAGARGILIGVALGAVVIGLRAMLGAESTFRE